jgi:hypothetical protein
VGSSPPIPRRQDGGELHEAARRWWDVWSETPQATVFTDTEWDRLADTSRLVDEYWRTDNDTPRLLELFREITRREEEELGWTGPAYRQRS